MQPLTSTDFVKHFHFVFQMKQLKFFHIFYHHENTIEKLTINTK